MENSSNSRILNYGIDVRRYLGLVITTIESVAYDYSEMLDSDPDDLLGSFTLDGIQDMFRESDRLYNVFSDDPSEENYTRFVKSIGQFTPIFKDGGMDEDVRDTVLISLSRGSTHYKNKNAIRDVNFILLRGIENFHGLWYRP